MIRIHRESHRSDRSGWLRAAVLGANDGTISVASLVVGVAASALMLAAERTLAQPAGHSSPHSSEPPHPSPTVPQ